MRGWKRPEDETSLYFWIYVIDHADSGDRSARYLLPQDAAHDGKIWYQNDYATGRSRLHQGYVRNLFLPTSRIEDVYWTDGVVELAVLEAEAGRVRLGLDSYCPGRSHYEASTDGATWSRVEDDRSLVWTLKPGWNTLRVHAVRHGGTRGPQSSLLLRLRE
jgi:hypothetical protein